MLQTDIYKKRFSDIQKRDLLWKILIKNFFQNFISKSDIVLDLACGYGEFINNIKCSKKYALDINSDTKNYLNKDVFFINSKTKKIPLKSNLYDKIFISNFFEHISRDEIIATVKEVKRVLKEGGKVLILQPNIRFCSRDYWMFFDHITPIDDRALIEIFNINGFVNVLNIEKFLPYTTKSKLPQKDLFVKFYLKIPVLWKLFGAQSFLVFRLVNK